MSIEPQPIRCRAKVAPECADGQPVESVYEDSMADDETFDGKSVVCNACYIAVEPFMRMSSAERPRDIPIEANEAIFHYQLNMEHVQGHARPDLLVVEAADFAAKHTKGSPAWTSAIACYKMAKREVEHRQHVKFEE